MGEHKHLFDTLTEAAQQTQWGDLPTDGDAVRAVQRLTSEAYAIAVQALNQVCMIRATPSRSVNAPEKSRAVSCVESVRPAPDSIS